MYKSLKRAESIVEDELKNIKTMVKKIPDSGAKNEADFQDLDIAVEKGKKYLDQVQKIASDKNINIQTEIIVAEGSVPKEVIEYAEGQKIDLIVVGTRGMTGIKKMLLGSTASDIVTYAHCPVLVVK